MTADVRNVLAVPASRLRAFTSSPALTAAYLGNVRRAPPLRRLPFVDAASNKALRSSSERTPVEVVEEEDGVTVAPRRKADRRRREAAPCLCRRGRSRALMIF